MRNMLPSPSASPSSLAVSVGLSPSIVTWSPACSGDRTSPLCASAFLFRIQAQPLQTCLYLSSYKARTSPSGIALLGGPSQPLLTPGSFLVVGLVLLIVHPCWELPGPGLLWQALPLTAPPPRPSSSPSVTQGPCSPSKGALQPQTARLSTWFSLADLDFSWQDVPSPTRTSSTDKSRTFYSHHFACQRHAFNSDLTFTPSILLEQ